MIRAALVHLRDQWMGALALFLVVAGGTAYAANTIGSPDVIDESLLSRDIKNGEVKIADVGQGAVATDELANDGIKAPDIGNDQVRSPDIDTGAVRTEELANAQVRAEDLAPGVAPGASGARAWGLVGSDGTLLRAEQVTGVTNPAQGVYCIDPASGIDPTTAVMVIEEDFAGDFTTDALDRESHAEWHSGAPDCPVGTMEVLTFLGDGNPPTFGEIDSGGFSLTPFPLRFAFAIP